MQKTGIAGYASMSGNRGVWMLRRDIDELTEFLMFTLWDSLDSVKAFAGQDYETAVFIPKTTGSSSSATSPQRTTSSIRTSHRPTGTRSATPAESERPRGGVQHARPRPSLGLPQRRHALGHRKRSLPQHRRTRDAVRKRIHGLGPQAYIKNMIID